MLTVKEEIDKNIRVVSWTPFSSLPTALRPSNLWRSRRKNIVLSTIQIKAPRRKNHIFEDQSGRPQIDQRRWRPFTSHRALFSQQPRPVALDDPVRFREVDPENARWWGLETGVMLLHVCFVLAPLVTRTTACFHCLVFRRMMLRVGRASPRRQFVAHCSPMCVSWAVSVRERMQ